MKAQQVANAARRIEARTMKRAREVRTRAVDKPVATLALIPHRAGRKSVILDFGLAEVNACYDFLKSYPDGAKLSKASMHAMEGICRQVVNGWLAS